MNRSVVNTKLNKCCECQCDLHSSSLVAYTAIQCLLHSTFLLHFLSLHCSALHFTALLCIVLCCIAGPVNIDTLDMFTPCIGALLHIILAA